MAVFPEYHSQKNACSHPALFASSSCLEPFIFASECKYGLFPQFIQIKTPETLPSMFTHLSNLEKGKRAHVFNPIYTQRKQGVRDTNQKPFDQFRTVN